MVMDKGGHLEAPLPMTSGITPRQRLLSHRQRTSRLPMRGQQGFSEWHGTHRHIATCDASTLGWTCRRVWRKASRFRDFVKGVHAPVDTPGYQPKSQAEDGPVARDAADVRRRAHVVFDGGPGQAESHSASGKKDSNYTPHGSDRSR